MAREESQGAHFAFPFTATPNAYIDNWMRLLSPTATVVMLALYRESIGWKRADASISYPKLSEITGISSFATISEAIGELLNAKLIMVKKQRGEHNTLIYELTQRALTFTDSVKQEQEQELSRFTETVKGALQKLKSHPYRNRKAESSKTVKQKQRLPPNQTRQEGARQDGKRGAKETLPKKELNKEERKGASASLQPGAPIVAPPASSKIEEEEETRRRRREQQQSLLQSLFKQWNDANANIKTARNIGRCAGKTPQEWEQIRSDLDRDIAVLQAETSKESEG